MVCIYCSQPTKVTNSRPQHRLGQTWRRRQCKACSAVFTTIELVELSGSLRVCRTGGTKMVPFSRDQLFMSIATSLGHRVDSVDIAGSITSTVIAKLRYSAEGAIINTADIRDQVLGTLRQFDNVAATHYEAYHPKKS